MFGLKKAADAHGRRNRKKCHYHWVLHCFVPHWLYSLTACYVFLVLTLFFNHCHLNRLKKRLSIYKFRYKILPLSCSVCCICNSILWINFPSTLLGYYILHTKFFCVQYVVSTYFHWTGALGLTLSSFSPSGFMKRHSALETRFLAAASRWNSSSLWRSWFICSRRWRNAPHARSIRSSGEQWPLKME